MKKFNYLLALFCVLAITGCSDDDEKESRAEELSKFYFADNLTINFNDELVRLQQVKFQTNDLKTAKIDLPPLLPGEERILADLTMEPDPDIKGGYKFSGINKNENREIHVNGKVNDTLQVTVNNTVTSKLAGKWKPATVSTIQMNIVPISEDAKANMFGILFSSKDIPVSDGTSNGFDRRLSNIFTLMFNMMVKLDLNLHENGNLTASWAPGSINLFEAGELEKGIVKYNMVSEQTFVSIAVEKLLGGLLVGGGDMELPSDLDLTQLLALVKTISSGMPIITNFEGDNKLAVLLPKEMVLPILEPLMPTLQSLVSNTDINIMGVNKESLPKLLGEILRVMKESKEFTIVFNLQVAKN